MTRREFFWGAAALALPTWAAAKGTDLEPVAGFAGLWRMSCGSGPLNGWLIVRDGRSLLIDCPADDAATAIRAARLPLPELILHTHVQDEHCREWASLGDVTVRVAASAADVARRSEAYFAATRTVWPPDRAWDMLGEEPYGIAGCVTERPPTRPLNVRGTFKLGEVIAWRGEEFEVLDLAASSKRAVGFAWRGKGALFTGDLLHAGGRVVNFYDLERRYNGGELGPLRKGLGEIVRRAPKCVFGATGPAIDDPVRDAKRLLEWAKNPTGRFIRRVGTPVAQVNYKPIRTFGRYREIIPDVYQNTNWGNVILFVDRPSGAGLMIDPCNCVWTPWKESVQSFRDDLRLLERETGLKRVELALITHPHGDHVQDVFVLREEYGTRVVATPDTAEQLKRPKPVPCNLAWYDFPYKTLEVEAALKYGREEKWRNLTFRPVWTPGHCPAHSGFSMRWRGRRLFCSGDALQYGSGPIEPAIPFCWNGNALPGRGAAVAYRAVRAERPEVVICGHSRSFFDADGTILRDLVETTEALDRSLADFVPNGDLRQATEPPSDRRIYTRN